MQNFFGVKYDVGSIVRYLDKNWRTRCGVIKSINYPDIRLSSGRKIWPRDIIQAVR